MSKADQVFLHDVCEKEMKIGWPLAESEGGERVLQAGENVMYYSWYNYIFILKIWSHRVFVFFCSVFFLQFCSAHYKSIITLWLGELLLKAQFIVLRTYFSTFFCRPLHSFSRYFMVFDSVVILRPQSFIFTMRANGLLFSICEYIQGGVMCNTPMNPLAFECWE